MPGSSPRPSVAALTRARNALHPGQLQREIDRLCQQLERLSLEKRPARQRSVNRSFTDFPPSGAFR